MAVTKSLVFVKRMACALSVVALNPAWNARAPSHLLTHDGKFRQFRRFYSYYYDYVQRSSRDYLSKRDYLNSQKFERPKI